MMPVCPLVGCGEMFRQNRILLSVLPSSFFFFTFLQCFLAFYGLYLFLGIWEVKKNTFVFWGNISWRETVPETPMASLCADTSTALAASYVCDCGMEN